MLLFSNSTAGLIWWHIFVGVMIDYDAVLL